MKRSPQTAPMGEAGERIPDAVAEYDRTIERAQASERRAFAFLCVGAVLALAGTGAVLYRVVVPGPPPLLAEMCRGDVLAVRSVESLGQRPPIEDIRDNLVRWVRGAREAGTDPVFFSRQAWGTYHRTRKGSQAEAALQAFHEDRKLEEVMRTKTIYLEGITAFPEGGNPESNTWRVDWTEVVKGRDGVVQSTTPWRMTVQFGIARPTDRKKLQDNPHGVFVESFSWEPVRASPGRIAEALR